MPEPRDTPEVGDIIRITWHGDGVRSVTEGIIQNMIAVRATDEWEFTLGHGRGHYTLTANPTEIEILHERL